MGIDGYEKTDDVENKLNHNTSYYPQFEVCVTPSKNDSRARQTAELINLVFKGQTPEKKMEASYMRKRLMKELLEFNKKLDAYQNNNKTTAKTEIIAQLADSSAFTAFKRYIVRGNHDLLAAFRDAL